MDHIDLAVIQASHSRVDGAFHPEDASSPIALERHYEPLVLSDWVSEDVHSDSFIVRSISDVGVSEVFWLELILCEERHESSRFRKFAVDRELDVEFDTL